VAELRARRTERLQAALRWIGLALGGEPGARLAERLAMAVSPDTLLRLVRGISLGNRPTPRVLGVDEWAWRKGRNYGTILCDLERHQVVDLVEDASTQGFANWLQAHQGEEHHGIEVVARDRGGMFADGAGQGAPKAIQVADRWHLLRNLGDMVERYLDHHRSILRAAEKASPEPRQTEVAVPSPEKGSPDPEGEDNADGRQAPTTARSVPRNEVERQERRLRRKGRYD
jgi:transposase